MKLNTLLPAILFLLILSGGALAGPINPNEFDSLGLFPSDASVTIDTDALTVTGVTGSGVLRPQASAFNPNVAVFAFDGASTLGAGQTIDVVGSRPAAVLFKSHGATVSGTWNIQAGGGIGTTGTVDGAGPGGGLSGGADPVNNLGGGGGGYRGAGGDGAGNPGSGGSPYEDIMNLLEGGSAGGGTGTLKGGNGGGALELGGIGLLNILGASFLPAGTDGEDSTGSSLGGAGGGSAGGLFIHAYKLNIQDTLFEAPGGNGGDGVDFGGGGGSPDGPLAVMFNTQPALMGDAFTFVNNVLVGTGGEGGAGTDPGEMGDGSGLGRLFFATDLRSQNPQRSLWPCFCFH